jgi:hypothetical protein
MFDRANAIRIIEDALDREPSCVVCGRRTEIRDVEGTLYLSCPAVRSGDGFIARIRSVILAHTDRPVLELTEASAA